MLVEVTVTLPLELVERATHAGLLSEKALTEVLERELERHRTSAELREVMNALQSLSPRLSEQEVEEELARAKAERIRNHTKPLYA
jgi:post-segregation antitoxin (ccd killing protein)